VANSAPNNNHFLNVLLWTYLFINQAKLDVFCNLDRAELSAGVSG
jgi:hypothetical protein